MNVETLLVQALADDSWGAPAPADAVARIERACRRRRRRRMAAGAGSVVVLAGVLGFGLSWLNTPQSASIRPAVRPPAHSGNPAGRSGQEAAAVSAAVQAAQRAAASEYNSATQHPSDCPKVALPVSPDLGSDAYQAVITYNKARQPSFSAALLQLDKVTLASADGERGIEVTASCGPSTAAHTLVVYATRTDMGSSASLAQQAYFVSRVPSGLRVWRQAH